MALAALATLLPAIASGQEATISGVVTEAGSGAPIENALVVAARNRFDLYTTTTDASGAYQLTVPMNDGLGEVQIVLEAAGSDHAPARFGGEPEVLCYFSCGGGDGHFTLEPGDELVDHDIELVLGGRIAGSVTAADTSDGLEGAGVRVYSSTEGLEFSPLYFGTLTDADGHWALPLALLAGDYHLITEAFSSGNYVARAWNNLDCQTGTCPILGTDTVAVTVGEVTSGIDFTLRPGASISGSLLPDDDLRIVRVVDGSGLILETIPLWPGQAEWSLDQLGGGSYYLELGPPAGSGPLVRQLHNGLPCPFAGCDLGAAQTVSFAAGEITSVTILIERGSNISGTLLDDDSSEPIGGANIKLIDAAGQRLAVTRTNAEGEFFFGAFPAGSYFLRTSMSSRSGPGANPRQLPYFDRIHGANEDCSELLCDPADATPLVLDGTTDIEDIEFRVTEGPVIRGRIFDQFTGAPINRGQVALYNDAGTLVGRYALDFFTGAYQTTALAPGTCSIEPLVSPAYFAVPGSVGPANAAGPQRSAGSMTVVVGKDDVEANVSVVDQAIDRIFRSRFMGSY
ncbi:MAG: carboxypeptidase regulatory-like domain-containing protein [Wenzhouxiangella sp.]